LLLSSGCLPHNQAEGTRLEVELWDVGNVFVQPKQTLILSLRGDGRVVSRVGDSGNPLLDVTLTQVPKTKIMVGQIDSREALRVLRQIEKAGFLKADKYSGLNTVDGPAIRLVFRSDAGSNDIQHVALDDFKYHAQMNTPGRESFMKMWDSIADVLRTIQVQKWRELSAQDGVTTEIPWRREGTK
jgi:hypothetical protein